MADEPQPALIVRRTEDGTTFGVPERQYKDLLDSGEYEDGGSTDLSVDAVPLHDELPLPKTEALREAGYRTVGELRGVTTGELQEAEGVGEATAEEIFSAVRDVE